MSLQQVRFVHTSDWRLETPLSGVTDVPADLREAFVDAPYLAAERVVQAALDQQVDLVVLAGNLLDIEHASPYTLEFMWRQLQRLDEQGITVYWLGGALDDLDLWPAQLELPKRVKLFSGSHVQQFDVQRDGKLIAHVVGQSQRRGTGWQPSDLAGTSDTMPRIAVACGSIQKRVLENKGVDYWALGGEDRHHVLMTGKSTAAYCGSPQGRTPQDLDAHGAVLVELQYGQAKTRLLETDLYRWRREKVVASDTEQVESVITQINRQLTQVPADSSGRFGWLLVWSVLAQGRLAQSLYDLETQERILRAVNQTTSQDNRWSLDMDVEPVTPPVDLLEEDTILGDFLRCVQRFETAAETWQELIPYLPDSAAREALVAEMKQHSDAQRQQLWRRVAAYGADLLRGEVAVDAGGGSRTR